MPKGRANTAIEALGCFPGRSKGGEVVNLPTYGDLGFQLLPDKIRDLIQNVPVEGWSN